MAGAGSASAASRRGLSETLLVDALKATLVALLATALGAGAAFGDTVDYDPGDPAWVAGTLANLPCFWAGLAFAAGALSRSWAKAALAGMFALGLAVATYYFTHAVFGLRAGVDESTLRRAGEIWLAAAVPAGFFFGLAGSVWRTGPAVGRIVAVGALASTSLMVLAFASVDSLLFAFIVVSVAVVVALLPRPKEFLAALALGLLLAGFAAAALETFVEAARDVR